MDKRRKNTRTIYALLSVLPLIATALLYMQFSLPTIDLLNDASFIQNEFSDQSEGGKSISLITKSKNELIFDFELKPDYATPYTGIELCKKNLEPFSVEGYKMRIDIKTKVDLRMSVRLGQYIGKDKEGNDLCSVIAKSFPVKAGESPMLFATEEISEVPEWWFYKNPSQQISEGLNEKDKIKYLWLMPESMIQRNKGYTITIKSLLLEWDSCAFWLSTAVACAIFYIILFATYLLSRKKEEDDENEAINKGNERNGATYTPSNSHEDDKKEIEYVYVPIERTESPKHDTGGEEDMGDKLLQYMGANYPNPDLKVSDVATELRISEDSVSETLKSKVGVSFRQHLNNIRLEEAKRLLKETDLQISEIAYRVGYNNIQHFNRVFKENIGTAPGTWRMGNN